MRVRTGLASTVVGMFGLVPVLALAQCGMTGMGHAGHVDHESSEPKPKAPSKEIRALLTDKGSRTELIQAVIADRDFMLAIVDSIARAPEWNALMRERLAQEAVPRDPAQGESGSADTPEPEHQH